MQLTARKREILRRVVEEYVSTGQPVGSRALVERAGLDVSSSTVRGELAELETLGLLTHPHTSAGRMPTESGYRLYAEELVETNHDDTVGLAARAVGPLLGGELTFGADYWFDRVASARSGPAASV